MNGSISSSMNLTSFAEECLFLTASDRILEARAEYDESFLMT